MTTDENRIPASQEETLPHYRVIQKGVVRNTGVTDFESLVTHHPGANSGARVVEGVVIRGEEGRRHAVIGGEIQEIEIALPGRSYGLEPDRVLIKKDFMLEDSRIASGGRGVRDVDVPSRSPVTLAGWMPIKGWWISSTAKVARSSPAYGI